LVCRESANSKSDIEVSNDKYCPDLITSKAWLYKSWSEIIFEDIKPHSKNSSISEKYDEEFSAVTDSPNAI
jgi:hypothetical protein